MCEKYPETFEFAPSAAAARRIFGEGKIACLMGAEGGHQINDSLAVLRMVTLRLFLDRLENLNEAEFLI